MPQASIVIATKDRPALLQRAVSSALAQRNADVEVVVVDDGSAPETARVLTALSAMDARVRAFRHEVSRGACAARNLGLRQARGRYYIGLDDDDQLTPDHVAKLLTHAEAGYALVASSVIEVQAHRRLPHTREAGVVTLDKLLHYNRMGLHALAPIDRMLAVGGFDEALPAMQDYDLWVRMCARYGPALRTAETTYLMHTDHESPRISTSSERRLQALTRFEQKHGGLMTAGHRKSMRLHAIKYAGEPLTLAEARELLVPDNARMVLSLLISSRLPVVQRVYHSLRSKGAR